MVNKKDLHYFSCRFRGAVLLASLCDALKEQVKEKMFDIGGVAEMIIYF